LEVDQLLILIQRSRRIRLFREDTMLAQGRQFAECVWRDAGMVMSRPD